MKLMNGCAAMIATIAAGTFFFPVVHASDACAAVLCLTFSEWDEIPECEKPVRKVLRDAALGKRPERCEMQIGPNSGGAGNAEVQTVEANRENCPAGHWNGRRCTYQAALRVSVDGEAWSNVWFDHAGNTATQSCPGALAAAQSNQNGTLDEMIAQTQNLSTFQDASEQVAALQPSALTPCTEEECGPLGETRPPLPPDQNCLVPPQVSDSEGPLAQDLR